MQLKGTQRTGEYLQELATIIDNMVHRAHIDFPKQHISREAAPSFASGLKERREIRCQLLLALKKTLCEAFKLEAAGMALRARQVRPR